MSNIRLATKGAGGSGSLIEIDGHDITTTVRGFDLAARVGQPTTVTLDVIVTKVTEYDGDAAVRVTPEFEQVLTGLGWTPPRP